MIGYPERHPSLFQQVCVDLLESGVSTRFCAPGRSMHPTIQDGERVTVRPVTPEDVRLGDVLLCRLDRGLVAHRVVRIQRAPEGSSLYFLRGDAAAMDDEPVEAHRVLGRVTAVERNSREIPLDRRKARILGLARIWILGIRRRVAQPIRAVTGRSPGSALPSSSATRDGQPEATQGHGRERLP